MAFDINFRSIIAFREIGKGHEAMVRFSAVMNMPPPMSKSTFQSNLGVIYNSYLKVANGSMHKAAEKVNDNPDNAIKATTRICLLEWCRHCHLRGKMYRCRGSHKILQVVSILEKEIERRGVFDIEVYTYLYYQP